MSKGEKVIIAISGKIGTGKSTIAKLIEKEFDFKIIDCDKIVHEMYENNQELIIKINDKFNLSEKKIVNRNELGKIVFSDFNLRKELEAIVYPFLEDEIKKKIGTNTIIDCQDIDKLDIDYDLKLITYCSYEEIVKRVSKRDSRSKEEIYQIIANQHQDYVTTKRTYSIDTSDDDLEKKVKKIIGGTLASFNWKNS